MKGNSRKEKRKMKATKVQEIKFKTGAEAWFHGKLMKEDK